MWAIVKNKSNKFYNGKFMKEVRIVCRTFWYVALTVGLSALSYYLIKLTNDNVTVVLGVAFAVVAIINLTTMAYRAARFTALAAKVSAKTKAATAK